MNESQHIKNEIAQLITKHGAVPPPWFVFPDRHLYDICWRMGAGEFHMIVFHAWWDQQKDKFDEQQRIEYFRKWPPPPRWLEWTIEVIWDITPWELEDSDAIDYTPYFNRMEELGFGSEAEFERDMDDPKWLSES